MNLSSLLILSALALFISSCGGGQGSSNQNESASIVENTTKNDEEISQQSKISFKVVKKGEDANGTPTNEVTLIVDGKSVLIASEDHVDFYELEKASYASENVPASAITSQKGWWAGGGHNYYAAFEKNELVVYKGETDEGLDPSKTQYKLFKKITSADLK